MEDSPIDLFRVSLDHHLTTKIDPDDLKTPNGLFWCLLMFVDVSWCLLMLFDRFWWSSGGHVKLVQDRPPWYINHQKTSKNIKNHQKPSKNINKHQKTSTNIKKDHLVFSGHLVFGGLFWWWSSGLWWSFLLVFLDVCWCFWCFLMFFDVFWSILVVKWWSGENRKGSIGSSSML